jgi:hypothetical protein
VLFADTFAIPTSGVVAVREYGSSPRRWPRSVSTKITALLVPVGDGRYRAVAAAAAVAAAGADAAAGARAVALADDAKQRRSNVVELRKGLLVDLRDVSERDGDIEARPGLSG